jgi:histidinol-phosphatase
MQQDWRTRYEAAIEAADKAARLALGYFDTPLAIERKRDESPVTRADREAEAFLRSTLQASFPTDAFLGEEHGETPGSSGFRWIIDPVDGTRSFVRGIPIWATLVGLEHQGEQIAGVVVAPAMRTTYRALRGDGAYRDGRRIRVSDVAALGEAHMLYSNLAWFIKPGRLESFVHLAAQTERQRGFGDYYGFVLVAQGSGDFMIEHGVHAWDVAAIRPIIEEAGGRFSNWDGGADIHRPDVLVSNGQVHDQALETLCPIANIPRR